LAGTRFSGFTKVSIVLCGRSNPRIFRLLSSALATFNYTDQPQPVDPFKEEFFNTLLV
jgi:hypothetical protein